MGFQDNSGDIIFDMVLTDEGRKRLAKGDGSFKVTHFALGDEEINYGLYDLLATTAYQDISILQTPILEAFTNNTSTMKSKLITLTENNILYLPILKLNQNQGNTKMYSAGHFVVTADGNTEDNNGNYLTTGTAIGVDTTTGAPVEGVIWGQKINEDTTKIRVDAGLDTTQLPPKQPIPSYAAETQYLIEMDNRLGNIVSTSGKIQRSPDAIDDDNVATYSFSSATENELSPVFVFNNSNIEQSATQAIAGPRSTFIQFKIASSANLRQSSYLFDLLGSTDTMPKYDGAPEQAIKYIDSIVKVTGFTTGYSVDIPIRYVKLA
jgi:hypothetical protein